MHTNTIANAISNRHSYGGLANYEGEMRGALFVMGLLYLHSPLFLTSYLLRPSPIFYSLSLSIFFFFQFIFSSLSLSCLERPQNFRFILIPLFLHDYCFTRYFFFFDFLFILIFLNFFIFKISSL
jgi:hypothetical protein